jgi:hypothetical protein
MASLPQDAPAQALPLFYKSLVPLSHQLQPAWGFTPPGNWSFARDTHAIPLTVDEFVLAQRNYPIVFGTGSGAAPLALVGLADGANLYVDAAGQWRPDTYVPAYVRRYPFMLAKLRPESDELSLCVDETSGLFADNQGDALFSGDQPTQTVKTALEFCDQFEQAIHRTRLFMEEIEGAGLVMDGELSLQIPGREQPVVYRGFRMINEDKVRELRGDQARKWVGNGLMGMIYAHLFSLSQMRDLFAMGERRAAAQG